MQVYFEGDLVRRVRGGVRHDAPVPQRPAARRTVEANECEHTWRRLLALSTDDKFILHERLTDHLGGDAEFETEARRIIRVRREVLDHMTDAASFLKLDVGTAPTARSYNEAAIALDLPKAKAVAAAWGG